MTNASPFPSPHVILEKNNLQTAQGWTKSYIELVASYVHPKTNNWQSPSITLSQLRAKMDLDRQRRLIGPAKNKKAKRASGRIFCFRQVYFTKSCQQIWVRVNQPFIPFIHHIWGETVLWGTVFYHKDLGKNAVFHNFAVQIALRVQYSGDRSTRGL